MAFKDYLPFGKSSPTGMLINQLGFSGSNEGGGVTPVADDFGALRQPLIDWLKPQIGQPGQAYQGEMVAPMSPQESQSFDFLRKYGETGYGPTFAAGQKQITDTLGGNYNPANSPYYQAVKAEAANNLKNTQTNIASNAAGGGRYFAGARVKQQGEASSESERGLNTLMGSLAQQERQNQLNVLPQALQYGQAAPQLELEKSAAFQSLGALPRNIQQMLDTSQQNEWQRANVDYPMQIAQMVQGMPISPIYQQNPESAISKLLGGAGQGAGQIGTALLMAKLLAPAAAAGCWVAKEVFGGWENPKTIQARNFIQNIGPEWFKEFYMEYGGKIAEFISDKPILKIILRPLFEVFAFIGRKQIEVC